MKATTSDNAVASPRWRGVAAAVWPRRRHGGGSRRARHRAWAGGAAAPYNPARLRYSGVARKLRQIERVPFRVDQHAEIVAVMARLTGAGDGWINLIPRIGDDEEKPTSLGFFALFSGGGTGVTMCTWIPESEDRHGSIRSTLGITHVAGRRAAGKLESLAVPIPESWFVEQDHPRRGLVLRVPSEETHERVLVWALLAVAALSAPRPIRGWQADIYLPAAS